MRNEENMAFTEMLRSNQLHCKFLMSAADYLNKLPSNAVRSHLNILCSDILRFNNFSVAKKNAQKRIMCEYCRMPWKYGSFSVKVLPSVKIGKKVRRILRRAEANKKLSKVEENLAKASHSGNTVVVKCQICQRTSTFETTKKTYSDSKVPLVPKTASVTPEIKAENNGRNKKTKKAFAGLKSQFVSVLGKAKTKQNKKMDEGPYKGNKFDPRVMMQIKRKADEYPYHQTTKKIKIEKPEVCVKPQPIQAIRHDDSGYIPLRDSTKEKFSLVKKEPVSKSPKISANGTKNKLFNPFNAEVMREVGKTSKKKLSRLKRLIAEEEERSNVKASLKDFLLGC